MRKYFLQLLCGVAFLALLGYRYNFNATAFIERSWSLHFKADSDGATYGTLDVSPTIPDCQQDRQERIRRVCERYADRLLLSSRIHHGKAFFPNSPKPHTCSWSDCPLLVSFRHKLLFCVVEKVASDSIKALFLRESGWTNVSALNNATADARLARVALVFYNKEQLREFRRALFVRHPFKRLASVYDDKVSRKEGPGYAPFYDRYFKRFVARRNITPPLSFVDFVDYLIETPRFDYNEHWMPYFERCQPCLMDYDFVGKLETADEDFQALFNANGLQELESELGRRQVNARNLSAEQFFMQLERNQIMALYRIYRFDFELFGYNILDYIDTFDNGMS